MSVFARRRPAKTIQLVFLAGTLIAAPAAVLSQSYRYMDESGNIYFVDRLEDVPRKYRSQIVGTPTPEIVDKRHPKPKPTKAPKVKKKKKEAKRAEVKTNYPSFFSKQPKTATGGGEPPPMPNIVVPTTPAGAQELGNNAAGSGSKPKENSTSLPSLKR